MKPDEWKIAAGRHWVIARMCEEFQSLPSEALRAMNDDDEAQEDGPPPPPDPKAAIPPAAPAKPYKLTVNDRRFLRSIRIDPE